MVQVHGNLGSRGHLGSWNAPGGEAPSFVFRPKPDMGSEAEGLTRSFLEQAFDPSLLAGMAAGGMAFQGMRRFSYLRAARRIRSNAFSEVLGYLAGFTAEVPAFVAAHKGLHELMGRRVNWGLGAWEQDLLHTGILLGSLKGIGAIPLSLGWKGYWGQGAAQLGMLGGTMGGKFMSAKLEGHPNPPILENWIHSLAVLLQFNLGGRLIPRGVVGEWNYEEPLQLNFKNPPDAVPPWILRQLKRHGQEAYPILKTQLEAPQISNPRSAEIIRFFGDMDYQDAKPKIYEFFFDQAYPPWLRETAGEALLKLESPQRKTQAGECPEPDSETKGKEGMPLRNLVRLGPWNRRQRKYVQVFAVSDFGNLPPPPRPHARLSREGVFLGQLADGGRAQLIPVAKAEPHPHTYRMLRVSPDQVILEATDSKPGEEPAQVVFTRVFPEDFPFSEGQPFVLLRSIAFGGKRPEKGEIL
jgi:hypothetical protein